MSQHSGLQYWHGQQYSSVFQRAFDLAIFGAGYAGFAAATAARDAGFSVLLVDSRGDLLWESGRAMWPETGPVESGPERWLEWTGYLAVHRALKGGVIECGAAEVLATQRLIDSGIDVLYYAPPVCVERGEGGIRSILVATRDGLRRVHAGQWIDATESGTLLRLAWPEAVRKQPAGYAVTLGLQRADWGLDMPYGSRELRPGFTKQERLLVVRGSGDPGNAALWILDGLRSLKSWMGAEATKTHMSHCSFEQMPLYEHDDSVSLLNREIVSASPAFSGNAPNTLAERFSMGLAAVDALLDRFQVPLDKPDYAKPYPQVTASRQSSASIAVAGLGTGGVFAAIAAGRAVKGKFDGTILGIEPQASSGGIGTIGGIHGYYYGVQGGLQQEADERTFQLMQEFGELLRVGLFSPWAKRIVLTEMLDEAGVQVLYGGTLFAAKTVNGVVSSALVAGPDGVTEIRADAWIDGTADAILTRFAGGQTILGRPGDGQPAVYSQSAGLLREKPNGPPGASTTNFDAGWCDPTDPEDLTRARLTGILQYRAAISEKPERLLFITPAIGLRQGPMALTDYTIQLDDCVYPAKFPDAIGYFACWLDSHNNDVHLDSPETLFWRWFLGQGRTEVAGEIPYRTLLPVGLDNVWIASRAFGVSPAVHHSARMQRDMQRIGEAAGVAAVLKVRIGCGSRDVPIEDLRAMLDETGTFDLRLRENHKRFGHNPDLQALAKDRIRPSMDEALKDLDSGEATRALWMLRGAENGTREQVEARLNSDDPRCRWHAAGVASQWGSPRAEEVLLELIRTPLSTPPNILLSALGLLRSCCSLRALPSIEELSSAPERLVLDLRVLIAMVLEQIARKHQPISEEPKQQIRAILSRLVTRPIPAAIHANPIDPFETVRAFLTDPAAQPAERSRMTPASTREDHTWQLDLRIAEVFDALGDRLPSSFDEYLTDPRAIVRSAFRKFSAGEPTQSP